MRRISTLVATAVAIAAMVFTGQAAYASESPTIPAADIAAVMEAIPGGALIDAHHASWPDLGLEMTSSEALAPFAVGTCGTGSVCAFSGANLSGSKLSWTTCGTFATTAFTVRSIADARSTGYLQARNGTTVVATANAGKSANVFGTVTNVRCVN